MSAYFKEKEPKEFRGRLIAATWIAAFVFFVLMVRLWQLQVLESGRYEELSQNNRIRTVKSPAPRGVISDRSGVHIAENRPGFDLFIVPEDVTDWPKTKEFLNRLVGLKDDEISAKLEKAKARPPFQAVKLREDLSWDETVKIESFKYELPGVILDVTPKRSYLFGPAGAHLLGYLGEISEKELKASKDAGKNYAMGDLIGKYGLEKVFEEDLHGIDGAKEIEIDALGRKVGIVNQTQAFPGNDMQLTIDMKTQLAAYLALKDKAGAAVAIDPSNGKVLAMVSSPGFDPNALSSGVSSEVWSDLLTNPLHILNNRTIQGTYPPASTFKPIAAAAALEEKTITPATRIYSGPSFRYGGRDWRDWKEEGHGIINVHRAIVESSDTFFYQVGLKLGVDTLAKYSRAFGFGTRTGIELQNEKQGLVPSTGWKQKAYGVQWFEGETISVSVGQGYMLVTPLQLANAYAAIANGGTLYKPRIIESIKTPEGAAIRNADTPLAIGNLNVSPETMTHVKNALAGVTHEDGGTASWLKSTNLKIAGKTGTAQVSKLIKRTKNVKSITYKLRDHAWFAGYAPYDDPKIAIAVIVEHGGFGSSAAAPVARDMFSAFFANDQTAPDVTTRVVQASASGATEGKVAND